MLPALGSAGLVARVNSLGAFQCSKAAKGVPEAREKVSGETIAKMITERGRFSEGSPEEKRFP